MSHSLVEKYGIDEKSLAARREFIRLGEEDRRIMMELIPWSTEVAPKIAEEFYDWQFNFGPTLAFFQKFSSSSGLPRSALRNHLESTQAKYFMGLFTGAQENWGLNYFENRLKVGAVHDRINLPQKWYIGSYCEYQRLVRFYLRKSFWRRAYADKAEEAILKVFNYDTQAVVDSFLLSTLESLGLKLESNGDGDQTEHLEDFKKHLGKFSGLIMENAQTLADISATTEQLTASISEISQSACSAANVANDAEHRVQSALSVIDKLGGSGEKIAGVVKVINSIASETNLLALNATIEAARAGEAGDGFAVVAHEVKELARSTEGATGEVAQNVRTIRDQVESMAGVLQEVQDAINKASEFATSIAGAVEEQTVVVREITGRVAMSAEASEQVTRFVVNG